MKSNALSPVFYTLITVVVVNIILATMAWIVGWPSVDGITMFFLGITTMIFAYLLDAALFNKKDNETIGAFEHAWRYRWRKYVYNYQTSSKRESKSDQLESKGSSSANVADPEFERARNQSALLIDISLAGGVAAILSLIFLRLF